MFQSVQLILSRRSGRTNVNNHLVSIIGVVFLFTVVVSSCSVLPIGPTGTDVPCLQPTAWTDEEILFVVRTIPDSPSDLLLAARTVDQQLAREGAHGAVYRLDAESGEFTLVDDSEWDSLDTETTGCPTNGTVGMFHVSVGQLEYEDSVIPVAGGTALKAVRAPGGRVTAVLSGAGGPPVPFISTNSTTGQHYHRLYSEADGTPIGPALRLGLGSSGETVVKVCWAAEDRYVIYSELFENGQTQLCVVSVGDEIDSLGDGEEP